MARKARVAVIHPRLGFGGSEAPALWTITALKAECDVTLISAGDVDLARLNAYYGTALAPEDFTIERAPLPLGLRTTTKFAALRGSFLQRYVQRRAPEFDVLISCYGPVDFGRRGIQMIADFSFVEEWRVSLNPGVRGWKWWWYGSPLRQVYMAACGMVSRPNPEAWKRNLTLSNSDWTADLLRQKYGMESQTVYPPVEADFPPIPFSDRDDGFICLGRISAEKRVDAVIEILSRVRQKGHNVHLHILGGLDDSAYGAMVKNLAERHKDWVCLEGWVMGQKKKQMLASHRYGIHGRDNEPFGIAVGEMVNAGCIVFVAHGGGQAEIANHPALVFTNEADAVGKIEAVLMSNAEQENIRHYLGQRANRFSAEKFQAQIRQAVEDFLQERIGVDAEGLCRRGMEKR